MRSILIAFLLVGINGVFNTESFSELKKNVNVSYQTTDKWSKPISREVTFNSGSELIRREVKGVNGKRNYVVMWFNAQQVAIIEIQNTRSTIVSPSFESINYLSLFMPSGRITGIQINGNTKRKWAFDALWPIPEVFPSSDRDTQNSNSRILEFTKKSESLNRIKNPLVSVEIAMKLGDKPAALRHLKAAERLYRRDRKNTESIINYKYYDTI